MINQLILLGKRPKNWRQTFVSLRGERVGYERKRVTPYMHVLFAHVPFFLNIYKCLKILTGQGVEKNNDTAQNVIQSETFSELKTTNSI